jgi:hypothetical protein
MEVLQLHPGLEALPERLKKLPVHRGFPVPWFVDWIDGVPELRAMDPDKLRLAIRERLCWVCGEALGRYMTFVAGPMCGINRTSAEPPSHLECARWSARNCPFLSKPDYERRDGGMEGSIAPAGHMLRRNPGVTLLWTTRDYTLFDDGRGGTLIEIGEPTHVEWWSMGKPATLAQVEESVRTGLPALQELADAESKEARAELDAMVLAFERFYPGA